MPWLHRTVAGSDGHRAKLDAAVAFLTEVRPDAEGMGHMAVLTASDKADRPGLPDLGADAHATPT